MSGQEKQPVAVVEIAVGARHVLAADGRAPKFAAKTECVARRGPGHGVRDRSLPLPVEKVPGVADTGGGSLRIDVNGRHERGQAAQTCFERVVDAQAGVGDVPVF